MATLIIGVGNADRGDDVVGLVVVRRLRGRPAISASMIEASGDGSALIEAWRSADRVILIDAIQSGAAPGTIERFEAHARPIPINQFRTSTHTFGVGAAIELARALGQLPPRLIVDGIEGRCSAMGAGLSSEAERAACEVLEQVQGEIGGGDTSTPLSDALLVLFDRFRMSPVVSQCENS